jgi:hypothetical protein
MNPFELLAELSWFLKLTLIVDAVPLVAGAVYAARPTEGRLALMRPLSLAALFAGPAGTLSGAIDILGGIAASGPEMQIGRVYAGVSEALIPVIFGLTCLMVAWLLVAVGMWRGVRDA